VYETGLGSCFMENFDISSVDPSGSPITVLVNIKMELAGLDCKDGLCMAQDSDQRLWYWRC
jgi:hypothetical protein